MGSRFFFGRDNDGHDYLVPSARRAEWQAWKDIASDDERAWDPPSFAKSVDGLSEWTFTDPIQDGDTP